MKKAGFIYYLKYCWHLEDSYFVYLILSELVQDFAIVSGIILPRYIIDAIFYERKANKALIFAGILVTVVCLSTVIGHLLRCLAEKSRDQMYRKFSLSFAKQIMEGDYENYENPEFLDIKEKALKCMSGSYGFAGTCLLSVNLLGKIIQLLSLITVVSYLDITMIILFAVLVGINAWFAVKANQKEGRIDFEAVTDKRKENYYRDIPDDLGCAKEIRLNALKGWIIDSYEKQFDIVHGFEKAKNMCKLKASLFGSVCVFLEQAAAYVFLIIKVFSSDSIGDTLTMGQFTMYLSAMLSFNAIVTEMLVIAGRILKSKELLEPFQRFMTWNSKSEEDLKATKIDIIATDDYLISFDHVSFSYPGQAKLVINDLSCTIKSGEKIAIVGDNGAGKSTFIKLLLGFYRPIKGTIYLNGVDILEYDENVYRKLFSAVFQDFKLFALSVRDNIVLDNKDYCASDLDRVISELGLQDKINSLNHGLDTSVYKVFDDCGFEPSGGEGQKIAMAKAFMRKAPIVVLDEPTASLDPKAEATLYKEFDKLIGDSTVIYVSHRLASCRLCDRVFVLNNGCLVESGTHDELMNINGIYAEMFTKQASLYA